MVNIYMLVAWRSVQAHTHMPSLACPAALAHSNTNAPHSAAQKILANICNRRSARLNIMEFRKLNPRKLLPI